MCQGSLINEICRCYDKKKKIPSHPPPHPISFCIINDNDILVSVVVNFVLTTQPRKKFYPNPNS